MLKRCGFAISLLLAGAAVFAAPPAAVPAAATAVPDEKTLEFLADWQGADGQFVDPMTFATVNPAKTPAKRPAARKTPVSSSRNAPPSAATAKAGA